MPHRQPILVVEDSPEDFTAIVRAFKAAKLRNPIVHCVNGDQALDYLMGEKKPAGSTDAFPPGVILLDLNLPGTDGREVLETIKRHRTLKSIPVIVLTTSTDERDIEKCYAAGANSYVQKPVDFDGFVEAVQRLKNYWFEIVILPRNGN